jgi:hypothetical protein
MRTLTGSPTVVFTLNNRVLYREDLWAYLQEFDRAGDIMTANAIQPRDRSAYNGDREEEKKSVDNYALLGVATLSGG